MSVCPRCGIESLPPLTRCSSCGSDLGIEALGTESSPSPVFAPPPTGRERIGGYRLLRKLGQGGMGVVYEAEQQSPRRSVALKVIRGGEFVDQQQLKLFQREVQALARLRHPGVAAIYEAGCTDEGQHFFAMELVRGETLSAYVAKRRADTAHPLTVKELLRLFLKICDAVSYAHQRGVLHRDLKPSNILVTQEGAEGPAIKMLDFGLARITDADVKATTVVSEVGRIQGTLAYMSPEQVKGNPDEIDLRSDVYSLGVILYELISGRLPYEIPAGAPLHQVVRTICEETPRSLSRSVSKQATQQEGGSATATLLVDRDLETIALKALEKEPVRRYQSATALSEDVERYLNHQPILARPASAGYQLRKLVLRHRAAAASLAAIFLLTLAFGIAMAFQARRIAMERDRALQAETRARTEAETAKRVTEFMVDLFKVSDPSEARGNTITAREVLDKGAERIGKELKDQPAVQATLQHAVGRVYGRLGLLTPGRAQLESALATRRRVHGNESLEVAASLQAFEDVLHSPDVQFDRSSPAEPYAREALAIRRKLLGDDNLEVASSIHRLGTVLYLKGTGGSSALLDEGEALLRQGLAIRRRVLGPEHPLLAESLRGLGLLLAWSRWDVKAAQPLLEEALSMDRRLLGDTHPDTLATLDSLALCYGFKGDDAATEAVLRELLAGRQAQLGDRHWLVARTLHSLGGVRARRGDLDEADRLLSEASNIPGGSDTVDTLFQESLAAVKRSKGEYAAAEALLRTAWLQSQKVAGRPGAFMARTGNSLASLVARDGRHAEAERIARESLAALRQANPRAQPPRLLLFLAQMRRLRGDGVAAATLFDEAASSQRRQLAELRQRTPLAWVLIAEGEWGLGASLKGLARFDEAEPLLLGSYPAIAKRYGDRDYRTREALDSIADLYVQWGKPEKAAEYRAMIPPPYRRTVVARRER